MFPGHRQGAGQQDRKSLPPGSGELLYMAGGKSGVRGCLRRREKLGGQAGDLPGSSLQRKTAAAFHHHQKVQGIYLLSVLPGEAGGPSGMPAAYTGRGGKAAKPCFHVQTGSGRSFSGNGTGIRGPGQRFPETGLSERYGDAGAFVLSQDRGKRTSKAGSIRL